MQALGVTLSVFLILMSSGCWCLDLNDVCDPSRLPYSSNPLEYDYNRCDPQKGLYCNTFSRCDCYVVDSYYDDYYDRCMAQIARPCQATHSFTIPCGEWAECEPGTGFCKCREGYTVNFDRKGCSGAGRIVIGWGVAMFACLVVLNQSFF